VECSPYEVGINPGFTAKVIHECVKLHAAEQCQTKISPELARRAWDNANATPPEALTASQYNKVIAEAFGGYLSDLCQDDYLDVVMGFTTREQLYERDVGKDKHPTVVSHLCRKDETDGKYQAGAFVIYNAFSRAFKDRLLDGIDKLKFMVGDGSSQGRLLRVACADPEDLCPLVIGKLAYKGVELEGIERAIHELANELAEGVNKIVERAFPGAGFVDCRSNVYLHSVEQIAKAVFNWHSDLDALLYIDDLSQQHCQPRDQRLPTADEMFVITFVLGTEEGESAQVLIDSKGGTADGNEAKFATTDNCIWIGFGLQKYAVHRVRATSKSCIRLACTARLSSTRKTDQDYFNRLMRSVGVNCEADLVKNFRNNYHHTMVISNLGTSSNTSTGVSVPRNQVPAAEEFAQIVPDPQTARQTRWEGYTFGTINQKLEPYSDTFQKLPFEMYKKLACNRSEVPYGCQHSLAELLVMKEAAHKLLMDHHVHVREKRKDGSFKHVFHGTYNTTTNRYDLLIPGTVVKANQLCGECGIKHSAQSRPIRSSNPSAPCVIMVSRPYKNQEESIEETLAWGQALLKQLQQEGYSVDVLQIHFYENSRFKGVVEILAEGGAPVVKGTNAPSARTDHRSDFKVEFPKHQDRNGPVNRLITDDFFQRRVVALFVNKKTWDATKNGVRPEEMTYDDSRELFVFAGYYFNDSYKGNWYTLEQLQEMFPDAKDAEKQWLRCRNSPHLSFSLHQAFSTLDYVEIYRRNQNATPYKTLDIDVSMPEFAEKLCRWVPKDKQTEALGFGNPYAVDPWTIILEWIDKKKFLPYITDATTSPVGAVPEIGSAMIESEESEAIVPYTSRSQQKITLQEIAVGDALVNVAAALRAHGYSICTEKGKRLECFNGNVYISKKDADKIERRAAKRTADSPAGKSPKRRKRQNGSTPVIGITLGQPSGRKRRWSSMAPPEGKVQYHGPVYSRPLKHARLGNNLRTNSAPASNRSLDLNVQFFIGWAFYQACGMITRTTFVSLTFRQSIIRSHSRTQLVQLVFLEPLGV